MRQYSRIKWDGSKMEMGWETSDGSGNGKITHDLRSSDPPRPEFTAALVALRPLVARILELPGKYGEKVHPRAVAVSWDPSGEARVGIVISSTRELDRTNSPFNLSTPILHVNLEEENDDEVLEALALAYEALAEQADAYIDGKRAQADLFEDEGSVTREEPALAGA